MNSDARSRKGRRLLARKLCLMCGSVLLALLLAELALRFPHFYYDQTVVRQLLAEGEELFVVHSDVPDLIYTFQPYVDGTNSQGYYDDEHSLEKAAGVFRIVVIGDSVAAGQKVELEESFPRLIEGRLNRSLAHRRFEVIVLARSGYATSQELVLLRREAFQYEPDLVLWSYCLNDPAHPLYHRAAGEMAEVYRPTVYLLHLLDGHWHKLKERINARGGPQEFHKKLHHVYWGQVAENIRTIGRLCAEHRVPAVFVIHPIFKSAAPFSLYPFSELHQKLRQEAAESGLLSLDLWDAYRDYETAELGFPEDPWHPNTEGHRLAAEFICDRLIEHRLVPVRPRGP